MDTATSDSTAETTASCNVDAEQLRDALKLLEPHAGRDKNARPALCQLHIVVGKHSTTLMATDSFTLAAYEVEHDNDSPAEPGVWSKKPPTEPGAWSIDRDDIATLVKAADAQVKRRVGQVTVTVTAELATRGVMTVTPPSGPATQVEATTVYDMPGGAGHGWRKLIPPERSANDSVPAVVGIKPAHLAKFVKGRTHKDTPAYRFQMCRKLGSHKPDEAAIRVTIPNDSRYIAALMPVRLD